MPTTSFNQLGGNQHIGGFEIIEKIGEGGMGAVYRAQQTSLERIVALKVLSPKLASDPKYTDSFLHEAKSAARLQHANIVAVFDAGKADDLYFYVMEFINGESLQKWVTREGALQESLSLDLAICVADALRHSWNTEQLIHRDIKPDNILVDTHGNVKLCDLGLAKYFGERTMMSLSGQVFGTPQYMSPEQARAEKVDCRTDIYALGLTLYYTLTAQIPFHGGTHGMVMSRQLNDQLDDPRDFAPATSVHTVRVIEKMVSKDAAQRYENWDDVLRDLRLARENKPPQIPLIFHGKSSMKKNGGGLRVQSPVPDGVARQSSGATGADGVTWEKPLQPRVKQPAAFQDGGTGVPPVDQKQWTGGTPIPPSQTSRPQVSGLSPQPSPKSHSALFVTIGIGLLLLLGVIAYFGLSNPQQPNSQETQPPVIVNPPQPPPVQPDIPQPPVLTAAARALHAANQFAEENASNFDQWQNIAEKYQQIANEFSNASEAPQASQQAASWSTKWSVENADRQKKEKDRKQQEEQQRKLIAQQAARDEAIKQYEAFLTNLHAALRLRDFSTALELSQKAHDNPSFTDFKNAIADWRDLARRAQTFWNALPRELVKLKDREFPVPNETNWFIGSVTQEHLEIEKRLYGQIGDVRQFKLSAQSADWLLALVDKLPPDRQLLLDAAWFCFALGDVSKAYSRLDAAQKSGLGADAERAIAVARQQMTRLETGAAETFAQTELAALREAVKNKQWKAAKSSLDKLRQQPYGQTKVARDAAKELADLEPTILFSGAEREIEVPLGNGVVMEFVLCPPGTFVMGSKNSRDNETPHKVTLTNQFYMGKFEVTQEQWQAVMGNNPSNFKGAKNLPVESVRWNDCQEFVAKLNQKAQAGRSPYQFRLPTEAEWEYACRAGSTGIYCFGDDAKRLGDFAWFSDNSSGKTQPVGSKKSNAWGLYDMHGNVWEWCGDWYGKYTGDATNPTGPDSGSSRVLRGGSWIDNATYCRSSHRLYVDPARRSFYVGLRLLLLAR